MSKKPEHGTIQAIFQKLVYEPEAKLARKRKKNTNGAFGKAKQAENAVLAIENDSLKSEVERLRSQFANSEWQPIETAPMDGTEVLCFCVEPEFEGEENPHTEMRVCFFGQMQEDYSCWMGYYGYEQRPTHWMPLPPKPPTK